MMPLNIIWFNKMNDLFHSNCMNDVEGSIKKAPWSEIIVSIISVCNGIRYLVSYVSWQIVIFVYYDIPIGEKPSVGRCSQATGHLNPGSRKKIEESLVAPVGLLFLWFLLLSDFIKATIVRHITKNVVDVHSLESSPALTVSPSAIAWNVTWLVVLHYWNLLSYSALLHQAVSLFHHNHFPLSFFGGSVPQITLASQHKQSNIGTLIAVPIACINQKIQMVSCVHAYK